MNEEVNLTIDGNAVKVPKGTKVYEAAKQLGIDLPIFCYQDRMPPFGACRVCLVEVEKMPKLQTSCTLEATEGMVVKTQTQLAQDGRKGIIEFLLINHPLDCPICDRGGECPLQENALNFGPGESRFFEDKRRFKKPLPLGPVLMLDRERCIVCARCTRFGEIVAKDHALELIDRGYRTEVGTPDGQPAESKFIGNTIMICPVGALTSQVYRFRARPWDNETAQSTCTLCPVGCSLFFDSRDGEIVRTRACENKALNDIWLCDKGWFGYEFTYHPDRLKTPLIRRNGKLEEASWEEALSLVASKLKDAKSSGQVGALGGNPLTVEENFLFQKLIREGAGVNNLDHRVGIPIFEKQEEAIPSGMEISLGDCQELSYAILCGLDVTEEFPVLWLRLSQAINQKQCKIFYLGNFAPEIRYSIEKTVLHAPGKELEVLKNNFAEVEKHAQNGAKGAIFVGRQYLNTPYRRAILSELLKFKLAHPGLVLNIMEGQGNSAGAAYAGMRPDFGPMGASLPKAGLNAVKMLEEARNGWKFLYVAGADVAKKYPSKLWEAVRARLDFLVVNELFLTETARQADVVFPTHSYVEKRGSFINIEGRVQKLVPGKELLADIYSDGEIFTLIAKHLGIPFGMDPIFSDSLKGHIEAICPSSIEATPLTPASHPLAAVFTPSLFDYGNRMKHDKQLLQLTKEPKIRIHPHEGSKRNLQTNDRIRVTANDNTLSAKVKLDDGVAEGTVVIPLGFDQVPAHELAVNLWNGMAVDIAKE